MKTASLIQPILSLCLMLLTVCWQPPVVKAQDSSEFTQAVERYRERIRKAPENLNLHREMIEYAQQTNRLEVPLYIYKAAYEKQPTNTTILYVLAYTYLMDDSESVLSEAEKLLQAAIEKRPQFADAYVALGKCYAAQGQTEAAIEAYQKSIQLNPNLGEVHLELGNYYRDQKNYQGAIEHYTQSLAQHPKDAVTHFNLGLMYRKIGNLEGAREAFSQAIKYDKNNADAYYQLGQIYALQQKPDDALKEYRKLSEAKSRKAGGQEFNPGDSKARYQLAHIFLDQDDGRHAILSLRSALVADGEAEYADALENVSTFRAAEIIAQILQKRPDNAELQHFAGKLFLKIDQREEARNHLERAKALDPNNAEVRFLLGQLYESDTPDVAIAEYKQSAELGNTKQELLLKLAETYRQEKNFEKFQEVAQQILVLDPNQPEIHYELANFYDEQSYRKKQAGEADDAKKLFNLAIEHADKAAKLAPNVARYQLKLAILYDRDGQLKALRFYEQAIELDPQNAEAYYRRGAFMSNYTFGSEKVLLYSPEDVMEDLKRAVQLEPNLSGAHYALGVAYDRMGKVDEAMVEFQKAVELDPSDARSQLYLAEKYANSGQPHRAISAFAAALKADPENVEALKDYAFLCLAHDEERRWREAKRALETAIQIRPNDPEILMNYGYTLFLDRENDAAIAHYLRSIQLKPDWALSHYNLGVAYEAIGEKELALAEYQKVMQLDPRGSQGEKAVERVRILKGEK